MHDHKQHLLQIQFMDIFCEIALSWMLKNTFDYRSTLVQVMTWCLQATSHYMSHCWPRNMSQSLFLGLYWLTTKKSSNLHFTGPLCWEATFFTMDSPHKWSVIQKVCPYNDIIMEAIIPHCCKHNQLTPINGHTIGFCLQNEIQIISFLWINV